MAELDITDCDGGVIVAVKVVPGASRTAMAGQLGGMLKIKVTAAPEKGKANQCLIEFLAKRLGVKKNAISIAAGKNNPAKIVQIQGVSVEEVKVALMRSGK